MSVNKGNIFKRFAYIKFMKAAEALKLVDIYSREIEIEDVSRISHVRLNTCV